MDDPIVVLGPSSLSLWQRVANPGDTLDVKDCAIPARPPFRYWRCNGPVPDERYFAMHRGPRDKKTMFAFGDCLEVRMRETIREAGERCFRPKDHYRPDIEVVGPPRRQWVEVKLQRELGSKVPGLQGQRAIRLGKYQFERYRKIQNKLPDAPIVYVVFVMETAQFGWAAFDDLRAGVEVLPVGPYYCFPVKLFRWESAGYGFCRHYREMINLYEPQGILPL